MSKTSIEQRDQGAAVLARLAAEKNLPAPLKPLIKAFTAQQKALDAATKATEKARATRDDALVAVGAADAALDKQVDVLADKLVGAGLGARKNPFAGYGAAAPSTVKDLAYTVEVDTVEKLVAAIKKKKPPQVVTAALTEITKLAGASKKALLALVAPQTAYSKSIDARDALLVEWTRAYERFRLQAKATWADAPATYRQIFAPPGLEGHHPVRRKKAPAPSPVSSAPSPPAPPSPPPATGAGDGA